VVFLWIPPEVRMARLRARHGAAAEPGGARHEASQRFLAWAAGYDEGLRPPERCRRLHEDGLAALPCPVVRFLDAAPTEAHLGRLAPHLLTRPATGGTP
jgi:hypothetical protein